MKRLMKGFTMIELLIVIAVLGVLAVAVLSAINPIEQINRGKDTGSRSDSEQLLSAIDRYYTTQNKYPWQVLPDDEDAIDPFVVINDAWEVGGDPGPPVVPGQNVLSELTAVGTQEIKQSFTNRINETTYNPLSIYYSGVDGDSVYICFQPKSGSFDTQALDRCGIAGAGLPTDLKKMTNYAAIICATDDPYSCLP